MGKISQSFAWVIYLLRKMRTNIVWFILVGYILSHTIGLHIAGNKLLVNKCRPGTQDNQIHEVKIQY